MNEKRTSLLGKFLIWRVKNVSHRNFMMFLAAIVGFSVGLAAVIIKNSVHFITTLLEHESIADQRQYLYFVLPAVGISLVVIFIRFVLKQHVGHGIPSVLYAISKTQGKIKRHNIFSSVITSALTVGFGGSVGLEGPTVATGAAIGSNIGRMFHLNYKSIILLLGCACAGAMASIFKAPITAIVFALEVIMLDLTVASIIPLLIASVSAALTSYFFLGQDVLYPFDLKEGFQFSDLPYYILLGVVAGLFSVYFTRVYKSIHVLFEKMKTWWVKLIIGAISLGVLVYIFPSLYGEGYNVINSCLQGDFSYVYENSIFSSYQDNIIVIFILFLAIILFKVVATSVTFGSGGVGGIFAPTLFIGANLGLMFSKAINYSGIQNLSNSNFALVGMAGMIAGVLHAPLTAIFLIAEITGGYGLFLPLMITATISYATVKLFEKNSVYTYQLAKRGELMTHHKDKAVLSMLSIDKLIENDFGVVKPDARLGDLIDKISETQRNIFPVVDDSGILHGIVVMDDIRHIMFKPEKYDKIFIADLMFMPNVLIQRNDTMEEVAHKFQKTGNYNLPVVEDGKYIGFVSRANVFSAYRRKLKHISED